jgi:hypothetical protein
MNTAYSVGELVQNEPPSLTEDPLITERRGRPYVVPESDAHLSRHVKVKEMADRDDNVQPTTSWAYRGMPDGQERS